MKLKLSIRIILIFSVAIIVSVIPDLFPSFFGDKICNGLIMNIETGKYEYFWHYGTNHKELLFHWGYRHWLFFVMGVCLFLVQLRYIIKIINK